MHSHVDYTQPLNLSEIYDELFPLCRSITGPGIRNSMEIMAKYMPLEIHGAKTGLQVFDWKIPPEWHVSHARLIGPDGEVVVDFDDHNLHLVNFSISYKGEMDLEELQSHLHSLPKLPDAIPYVTSYYQERWGFCMTNRQRETLQAGTYKIDIKTEHKDGVLNYATAEIKGVSDKIILITSYLCHPSMANNELSGPLALLSIYRKLAKLKNPYYTYRFLLIPETIGSITYMALHGKDVKDRIFSGMVLTCLGGPNTSLSFKLSRNDWLDEPGPLDQFIRHLEEHHPEDIKIRSFTPTSGSDERQFCSPGLNLPFVQAARTKYGEYDAYHTSADNKNFMRIERVEDAANSLAVIFTAFDYVGQNLQNNMPYGEPQLGRRDLYPSINSPLNRSHSSDSSVDSRTTLNRLLIILNLADGQHGIMKIADKAGCSSLELLPIIEQLFEKKMLKRCSGSEQFALT